MSSTSWSIFNPGAIRWPHRTFLRMSLTSISDEIKQLYQRGEYSRVIEVSLNHSISPGNDPLSSNLLAASYFLNWELQGSRSYLGFIVSTI